MTTSGSAVLPEATSPSPVLRAGPRFPLLRPFVYVFLLSLVVRVLWAAHATVTPIADYFNYDRSARHWIETGELCQTPQDRDYRVRTSNIRAYRTPGYIGLVALLYLAFGHNWGVVGAAQAVLGALTSGLLVVLAARMVCLRVGVIAGFLHALWPTAVVYVPVIASDNLLVFLLVAGLTCLTGAHTGRYRWWLATGAGLCFGLMMLARPSSLFIFPGYALLCLYNPLQRVWRPRVLLLCLILTAAVLTPWLVRNYRLGYGFPVLSTQGGYSLWWGNNWRSLDGGSGIPPRFPLDRHMSERDRDQFFRQKALAWIRENPRRYLALSAVRLARLFGTQADNWAAKYFWPTEANDRLVNGRYWKTTSPEEERAARAMEGRNCLWHARSLVVVAPIMLVSVLLALTRWRAFAFVLLPLASYVAGLALTVFAPRYRLTSDPLILICGAALLADLIWNSRETGRGLNRWAKSALLVLAVTGSAVAYSRGWDSSWYRLLPGPAPQPAFDFQPPNLVTVDGPRVDQVKAVAAGGCRARLTVDSNGLRVDLRARDQTDSMPRGGLTLPVSGFRAARLRLAFVNPRYVEELDVSGLSAAQEPLLRWTWTVRSNSQLPSANAPKTFVLVPGQSSDFFVGDVEDPTGRWARLAGNPDDQPVQAMRVAREVEELRIIVKPKPGREVSLLLHELTLAATGIGAPGTEVRLQPTDSAPLEDEDLR